MYGSIKFFDRVENRISSKTSTLLAKCIEIFNRLSLVVFGVEVIAKTFKFEFLQFIIIRSCSFAVVVTTQFTIRKTPRQRSCPFRYVYPFHSVCSLNTHCDVVVRFEGVNVIKRFRYIIFVVSVADCFHLSGTE